MRVVDAAVARIEVDRDSVIACVPLIGVRQTPPQVLTTVAGVLAEGERAPRLVIAGTRQTLEQLCGLTGDLTDDVLCLRLAADATDAQLLQTLLDACAPADVALLTPGVVVHPQWLRRLRAAAGGDTLIASASALFDADRDAAEQIAAASLNLRPRIQRTSPHCVLLRRQALDLLTPISAARSYDDALGLLSARLRALGMVHVAADDVAVNLGSDAAAAGAPARCALGRTDPLEEGAVAQELGPLPRALRRGRLALGPLRVTVDARSLTAGGGGTQTYVLGLALALARDFRVRMRALVAPDMSRYAAGVLADAGIDTITPEQAQERGTHDRSEIVHRPQQISSPEDFAILRMAGERLVVTHQDLIAYHNDAYHRDIATWERHREITRAALAAADRVVFFSEHARADALAEDLVPASRAHVVGIGVEQLIPAPGTGTPPAGATAGEPFIFCLGADYAHKNRPFAIRLLRELRVLGWPGRLLLAGTHVPHGSSRPQEQELLDADSGLRNFVIDLGAVDEPTKRWLFEHACALVYPSVYEGFGLLPLEAARSRLPCLYAPQTSLAELDAGAATLLPWDAAASARAVLPLLAAGQARERHLEALGEQHAPSWSEAVDQLVEIYAQAATSERAAGAWLDPDRYLTLMERLRETRRELDYHRDLAQDYQDALHALEDRVGVGLPLVDREGLLSYAEQRGLMRVASRPIGALALAPFKLIGSLGGEHGDDPR